ncbi:hypothetical protein E2C01_071159 [Portunus trituberculatus]|uniref:Uncharacterized protein n=1 Tax=Portunus trituberculatus TaxID=210409 RepID=A0A5B7HUM6_PORTR|nr:hypothetical protein [Portunus trituberculatus]
MKVKVRVNMTQGKLMNGRKDKGSAEGERVVNGGTLLLGVKFLYLGERIADAGSLKAEVLSGRGEIKGAACLEEAGSEKGTSVEAKRSSHV